MDNSEFISPKKKQPLSRVIFAEVGALELSFVITALLLIFSVLNYFRIVDLTAAFPFLSFLPRQTVAPTVTVTTTKTFVSRTTVYIGRVTSVNGVKLTIANRGSVLTVTTSDKTLFNTIPPSFLTPRIIIPGQDMQVGNNVELITTQLAGKNPYVSLIYKLNQSTFNSLNRSIP